MGSYFSALPIILLIIEFSMKLNVKFIWFHLMTFIVRCFISSDQTLTIRAEAADSSLVQWDYEWKATNYWQSNKNEKYSRYNIWYRYSCLLAAKSNNVLLKFGRCINLSRFISKWCVETCGKFIKTCYFNSTFYLLLADESRQRQTTVVNMITSYSDWASPCNVATLHVCGKIFYCNFYVADELFVIMYCNFISSGSIECNVIEFSSTWCT